MTDEPKAGSEIDWEAAKESSESWAKGRPLLGDLKCTNAEETLAIAYLALRAELAQAKEEIERLNKERERRKGSAVDRLHNVCDGLEASDAERELELVAAIATWTEAFYQLWDLADRAVGGDISETAFVDGRKEIMATLAARALKPEPGR